MKINPLLLIVAIVVCTLPSFAGNKKRIADPNLSTNIKFSGSTVSGRYQVATEAIAAVEDEKVINDLLKPRVHFKDRVKLNLEER